MNLAETQATRPIYRNQLYSYTAATKIWNVLNSKNHHMDINKCLALKAPNKIKCLGRTLAKYVKNLCAEHYKTPIKEKKKIFFQKK